MSDHFITLPNGNPCGLQRYVAAWKKLRLLPPTQQVAGWQWHSSTAADILRDMRKGLHDRINRHDRTRCQNWRKMDFYYQQEIMQAAWRINTPRLIIDYLPVGLKTRFSHRLRENRV